MRYWLFLILLSIYTGTEQLTAQMIGAGDPCLSLLKWLFTEKHEREVRIIYVVMDLNWRYHYELMFKVKQIQIMYHKEMILDVFICMGYCLHIYLLVLSQRGSRSNTLGVSTPTQILVSMLFSSKRNQVVREMTDSRKGQEIYTMRPE